MILASKSPRRAQLLREAGYDFRIIDANIDEAAVIAADPRNLVLERARNKAASVAPLANTAEIVIASDTAVVLSDTVLGKPIDDDDARRMLHLLSGKTHYVATAVYLLRDNVNVTSFIETCDVTFWDLGDDEIDAYIASGEARDKAGAYGIQGQGRLLIKAINGDYYTVVGLPISRLVRELYALGAYPIHAFQDSANIN